MENNTCPIPKKMKFIITVVNREEGEKIASFYREHGLTFNLISPGYGAAGLEIRDYLGLTETEKDIVISIADEEKAKTLLPEIAEEFKFHKPGSGIAFTVPIAGISGPKALNYVSGFGERNWKNE